jgi:hypothetical protein
MKKWLDGAVDRLVARATQRVAEKAAEEAAGRAVRKVKDTAREALDRAEDALFGPDDEESGTGAGKLQQAREDADRRARERAAAEAALEQRREAEIDDELAQMKRRLGRR